jgi:probable rRNA maturation factor
MIEDRKWSAKRGLGARLKKAAALTLARGGDTKGALTILLSNDKKLHALNVSFRGKDKVTNVLSFPARRNDYLGDIAIAYGVTAREARGQKKLFADHATHLVVHGVLHLLGYDHETARAARVMEPLESKILGELKIADPYSRQAA